MENKENTNHLLKMTSMKVVLLVVISTMVGLGAFQIIHLMGWPNTVMWFFGSFIWIFVFLLGFLNILTKVTAN